MTTIRVGVQATSSSAGQVVDFDSPSITLSSIVNQSAVVVQYSTNGTDWTSIAAGATASPGATVDTTLFRVRLGAPGAYPAPVDLTFEAMSAGAVPGAGNWGAIAGTLSDQTDLQEALDAKAQFKPVRDETGTSFVLTAANHANRRTDAANGSAITATWNVGHGMTKGDAGRIMQTGPGAVSLVAGTGARTLAPNVSSATTTGDGSWLDWEYMGADEIVVTGVGVAATGGGLTTVADFAALLALPSPAAGLRATVTAAVIPGGIPFTRWVFDGSLWRMDGPQDLLVDNTTWTGTQSTAEQIGKQITIPGGLLPLLRYFRFYFVGAKDTGTNTGTLRIRAGTAGTISDPLMGPFLPTMAADRRQATFDSIGHFPTNTGYSVVLGGNAGWHTGTNTGATAPQISAIATVASPTIWSASMQLNGTTDTPSIVRFMVSGA